MLVYKLAKRYIIISPDTSENNLSKLKNLLPATLLSFVGSGVIYLWQKSQIFASKATSAMSKTGDSERVIPRAQQAGDLAVEISSQVVEPNYALFFLIGSLFVILVILLTGLLRKK